MGGLNIKSVLIRYGILLLLGIGGLFIFYLIVTPLTVYPVFAILNALYGADLLRGDFSNACDIATNIFPVLKNIACMNTTILFKGYFASIISACIAGSAYYLLIILNLTTPMKKSQRIKSLIFLMFSFLIINILRIIVFAIIFANKGFEIFDVAHAATWYFGSTVLVVLLWFSNVLLFKIHNIPIYTDIKGIISHIKNYRK